MNHCKWFLNYLSYHYLKASSSSFFMKESKSSTNLYPRKLVKYSKPEQQEKKIYEARQAEDTIRKCHYHITEVIIRIRIFRGKSKQNFVVQPDIVRPPSNKAFCCRKYLQKVSFPGHGAQIETTELNMYNSKYDNWCTC